MTVKPIVVGTDGSVQAVRAVVWAAREAALRRAPLRIVAASGMISRMRVPGQAADSGTAGARPSGQRDHDLATAASAAAAVTRDLPVETAVLDGPPALAVARSARGAQLLVVGSHGSIMSVPITLGSVSRYATEHASCPVVVVREAATAEHRPVVVGIRIPEDCGAALAFAYEEARLRKAPLRAVYAWQSQVSPAADTLATVDLEDLLYDWRGRYPDVEASLDVVHGHPGRVLTDLSADAALVVLGRHAPNSWPIPGPARAVRTVVNNAHGPVVIVPPKSA
jgi:nucleotide-binding universal stress UspA family protein